MENQPDLSAMNGALDPETFRRVWARVMPEGRDSPVLPGPLPAATRPHAVVPKRPPVPTPPPKPTPVPPPAPTGERELRRLMDLLAEGLSADLTLRRRAPGGPLAARLTADHRRAMGRLSAAHFLLTGRRYRPEEGNAPGGSGNLEEALRREYLWERRWREELLRAEERVADPDLKELFRELTREGESHLRSVRTALERQ